MNESQKTKFVRGPEVEQRYLAGRVIDIGAGKDLVTVWAERFDLQDGDANHITRYRPAEYYDAVHSSHCLEHMNDPEAALKEWWSLLKPGGYLVIVVPHEDLYEQGFWPSKFNSDHKSTFRIRKDETWSPVSFDIEKLVCKLPGSKIISAEVHDIHYDYRLQMKPGVRARKIKGLGRLSNYSRAIPVFGRVLDKSVNRLAFSLFDVPLDQTREDALAQIQVIAQKSAI